MTRIINGQRRYGCWAGNPNGRREDPKHCIEEIYPNGGTLIRFGQQGVFIPCQCSRKRGHGPDGLYCKQHAQMIERRTVIIHHTKEAEQ